MMKNVQRVRATHHSASRSRRRDERASVAAPLRMWPGVDTNRLAAARVRGSVPVRAAGAPRPRLRFDDLDRRVRRPPTRGLTATLSGRARGYPSTARGRPRPCRATGADDFRGPKGNAGSPWCDVARSACPDSATAACRCRRSTERADRDQSSVGQSSQRHAIEEGPFEDRPHIGCRAVLLRA